jgi:imidazolonepropionase-like amidohydrolase
MPFYKQEGNGSFLGRPVRGIDDFKLEFARLLVLKPDHLKLILTGLLDFRQFGKVEGIHFTFQELYYMIQTAKNHGLPVMVHANSAEAVRMAVLAGADTIEHGYYLSEQELLLMKEKGTVWVPTLTPLGNLLTGHYNRYTEQLPVIRQIFHLQQTMIHKAYAAGVKIAAGSDAGSYGVIHGQGYFDEISYLEQTGLSRQEVDTMCSMSGREVLLLRS